MAAPSCASHPSAVGVGSLNHLLLMAVGARLFSLVATFEALPLCSSRRQQSLCSGGGRCVCTHLRKHTPSQDCSHASHSVWGTSALGAISGTSLVKLLEPWQHNLKKVLS